MLLLIMERRDRGWKEERKTGRGNASIEVSRPGGRSYVREDPKGLTRIRVLIPDGGRR